MEVRGKQGGRSRDLHEVLADGPRKAKAIIRGRAAPQLVDDDQAMGGGTLRIP